MFEMSWWDYTHNQFKWQGAVHKLYKTYLPVSLAAEMLFLLNIHRHKWIFDEDIIEFIYFAKCVNKMPNNPAAIIRTTKWALNRLLPKGVTIINNQNRNYQLIVSNADT